MGGAIGLGGFLLFALFTSPAPAFPRAAQLDMRAPAKPTPPVSALTSPEGIAPPMSRTPVRPFGNCAEARAAGHAPVYAGEPGYGPWLDGDRDGIGCEPYYGR